MLTAVLALAPLVDAATADTIRTHVQSAYPEWPNRLVEQDRNAIVIWLGVTGLLGIAAWFWAIRSTRRSARTARRISVTMFVLGLTLSVINLSVGGAAYDQVIPLPYGMLGMLPVAVGVAALIKVRKLDRTPTAPHDVPLQPQR